MRTKRNIITMDEYGQLHFFDATANDIWMRTNELIEVFGITYSTLRGNIKAIYKSVRCKGVSNYPMELALRFMHSR